MLKNIPQKRFHFSENTVLIFISVVLGLGTAALVLLFREAFHGFNYFIQHIVGTEGVIGGWLTRIGLNPQLSVVITLPIIGLIVGFIVQRFVGEEKHHGAAALMEAVALTGGRLKYRKNPFKTIASILSIGGGASMGAEDPSVQIGANLGSFFGEKLRLSDERRKLLVAAGAASAIATAFQAPIAGVFFALEIILGEFTSRSFGVVVLAAVISSATSRYLLGGVQPVFGDLDYQLGSSTQLPFYLLLGVLLAFVSSGVVRFYHWQYELWHGFHVPMPIKTASAGLLVAIVAVYFPQIMGPSEETMHGILSGHLELSVGLLIALALAKMLTNVISQGGGFQGGVFAPMLFVGISLGNAYGKILGWFASGEVVGTPHTYAIAGMAAMLAGVLRAPITAILLVFELTDDYLLILPIMLTAVVCTMIAERLGVDGIYMHSLVKHGLRLSQGRDIDLMQGIEVREAMLSPAPMIRDNASLPELREAFLREHTRALCVVDGGGYLAGIVTLGDLQRAFEEAMQVDNPPVEKLYVLNICSRDVLTVAPNEMLWTAIRSMGTRDIGRLPVVARDGKVLGMLRRQDIMNAYNLGISRKLQDQHYAEQVRLHTLTGAHVLEFEVKAASTLVDKFIKEVQWPPEAAVASISRKGKLIVPHGDTRLLHHDRVTIVADPDAEPILQRLFGG
jgi:chloride channel protein, CIC family